MKKKLLSSYAIICIVLTTMVVGVFAWYITAVTLNDQAIVLTGEAKDALSAELYIGKDWNYDGVLDDYYYTYEDVDYLYERDWQSMAEVNTNYYNLLEKDPIENLNEVTGIAGDKIITYKFVLKNTKTTPISLSFFFMNLFEMDDGVKKHFNEPVMFQISNIVVTQFRRNVYESGTLLMEYGPVDQVPLYNSGSSAISLWDLKNNQEYFDFMNYGFRLANNQVFELEFKLTCLQLTNTGRFYNTYYHNKNQNYFNNLVGSIDSTETALLTDIEKTRGDITKYIQDCYDYLSELSREPTLSPPVSIDLTKFNNYKFDETGSRHQQNISIFVRNLLKDMKAMSDAIQDLIEELNMVDPDVKLVIGAFAIHVTWLHA